MVELIPVRLEGLELSQNSAAPPNGPAPGGGPARTIYNKNDYASRTKELVRIPLQPEERQEPERDGEPRQHRQIRPHARTADPRVY